MSLIGCIGLGLRANKADLRHMTGPVRNLINNILHRKRQSLGRACKSTYTWAPSRENLASGFQTRWDSNRLTQLQKLARVLKFWLQKLEVPYYQGNELQRHWSDCADAQADLHLCCSHMAKQVFSLWGTHNVTRIYRIQTSKNCCDHLKIWTRCVEQCIQNMKMEWQQYRPRSDCSFRQFA